MARTKADPENKKRTKAFAMKLAGYTTRRIAMDLGVFPSTVSRWFDEGLIERLKRETAEEGKHRETKKDLEIAREALARVASRAVTAG